MGVSGRWAKWYVVCNVRLKRLNEFSRVVLSTGLGAGENFNPLDSRERCVDVRVNVDKLIMLSCGCVCFR